MHVCDWIENRAMKRVGAIKLGIDAWGKQEEHAGKWTWNLSETRYVPAGKKKPMVSFKTRATTCDGHRVEYRTRIVNGLSCVDVLVIAELGLSISNYAMLNKKYAASLMERKSFAHQRQFFFEQPIPDWPLIKEWVNEVARLEEISTRKVTGGKNKRKDS